jgi:ferredoxin
VTEKSARPKLRARVDHQLCLGVGMCRVHAPNAFRFNDERLSVFDPHGEWSEEELREAVDGCPMSAISVLPQSED